MDEYFCLMIMILGFKLFVNSNCGKIDAFDPTIAHLPHYLTQRFGVTIPKTVILTTRSLTRI